MVQIPDTNPGHKPRTQTPGTAPEAALNIRQKYRRHTGLSPHYDRTAHLIYLRYFYSEIAMLPGRYRAEKQAVKFPEFR